MRLPLNLSFETFIQLRAYLHNMMHTNKSFDFLSTIINATLFYLCKLS